MIRLAHQRFGPLLFRGLGARIRHPEVNCWSLRQRLVAIKAENEESQLVLYARDEKSTQQIAALLARDLSSRRLLLLVWQCGGWKERLQVEYEIAQVLGVVAMLVCHSHWSKTLSSGH